MGFKILILTTTLISLFCGVYCKDDQSSQDGTNATNKDMYFINAVVYQVGILVNKTDNLNNTNETKTGADEAITIYQHEGAKLNLSDLPKPLLTNVTKQSLLQTVPGSILMDHPQNTKKVEDDTQTPTLVLTMSSTELSEKCSNSLTLGKKLTKDTKEDSIDSARETSKSEKNKGEDDCRRRTIIVEKKNGSYGFTLQSYGIHYKKEKEIEVITYVDNVEADGPAGAAGMREGDVILSINGLDVEHAEHSDIVKAISSCDSRMRMVVIFEDCVRKVELHLKFINIQRNLQNKMRELDQLNIKERQILDTNWKTHSLPSSKKKPSQLENSSDSEDVKGNTSTTYYRPTLSSENVTSKPAVQNILMYQYLDPRYGTCLIQPNMQTGSFVITVESPRNRQNCHHYVLKQSSTEYARTNEDNNSKTSNSKHGKNHKSGHGCTPCVSHYNNQDGNSLEAYDLASPCCDPQCVPTARKKIRRKKECSKETNRKEKTHHVDRSTQKHEHCSHHSNPKKSNSSGQCISQYHYLTSESIQTSQCSLQSYRPSTATPRDNSVSSYSTSLSTDTLYWDNERSETKSSPKIQYQSSNQHNKPKSWDNLTTKAFGGYGFGYGYLDTGKQSNRSKSHSRSHSGRNSHSHHEHQHHPHEKHTHRQSSTSHNYTVYARSHTHCPPTKSTESLIAVSKYQMEPCGSETRVTCDCADTVEYYTRKHSSKSPSEIRYSGHYQQAVIYPSTRCYKKKESNISSEITRL